MNPTQHLDPEQQRKGVDGREDNISGKIKGKDSSGTTYNPNIHPPEEQRIHEGSTVLGGDNIEDRDPNPTKMSTNTTPIYANSQTFLDQEQKPKAGALRQEEDHETRNGVLTSKEQPKSSDGVKAKPRMENTKEEPPKQEADFSNSEIRPRKTNIEHPLRKEDPSKEQQINKFYGPENIPVGYPILNAENGDRELGLAVLVNPPQASTNENRNANQGPGKIEVEVKVDCCSRCSIL